MNDQTNCPHRICAVVNTYLGGLRPENIIATNHQCAKCGKVLAEEEYKKLTEKCDNQRKPARAVTKAIPTARQCGDRITDHRRYV